MPTDIPWWRRTRDENAIAEAKRRLERPMMALAVVFTITLVAGEVAEMSGPARAGLAAVNVGIWAAFAVEYVWLLRLAPDRGRFVRTHWLDLVIVLLPLLRPLRVLRLVRLLRAAQLASVAAHAWRQLAAVMRHRGMGGLLVAVAALLAGAGAIAYVLEPETFTHPADAIWWVVVTSTTVGYGDIAPVGIGARLVAVAVMIVGVGVVGVITANIVDYLVSADDQAETDPRCPSCLENNERLERIEQQLARLVAADSS